MSNELVWTASDSLREPLLCRRGQTERSEAIANDSILEGSDFGTDDKKLADLRQRSEQAGKWQRLLRVSPSSDLADLSQVLQRPVCPLSGNPKNNTCTAQQLHARMFRPVFFLVSGRKHKL